MEWRAFLSSLFKVLNSFRATKTFDFLCRFCFIMIGEDWGVSRYFGVPEKSVPSILALRSHSGKERRAERSG